MILWIMPRSSPGPNTALLAGTNALFHSEFYELALNTNYLTKSGHNNLQTLRRILGCAKLLVP